MRYDSTTEVWIAGNDPFSPYILEAYQGLVHHALCAVEYRETYCIVIGSNMGGEEFSPHTQVLPKFAYADTPGELRAIYQTTVFEQLAELLSRLGLSVELSEAKPE